MRDELQFENLRYYAHTALTALDEFADLLCRNDVPPDLVDQRIAEIRRYIGELETRVSDAENKLTEYEECVEDSDEVIHINCEAILKCFDT